VSNPRIADGNPVWDGAYCREADFTDLCRTDMRAIAARAHTVSEAMRESGLPFQELGGSWHGLWETVAAVTDGHVDRRSRVLIVGATTVPLTYLLAAEGVQVCALADDPNVCAATRSMAAALGLPVRIVLSGLEQMAVAEAVFQRVFVLRASELPVPADALARECARALGPEGRLIISVVSGGCRPALSAQAEALSDAAQMPVLGGVQDERPPDTAAETIGLVFLAKPGRAELPLSRDVAVQPLPLLKRPRAAAA
jgi:SAM-dependent methyltransferase